MTAQLVIYTRKDCCLCEEMKAVIFQVAAQTPLTLAEIDVDGSPQHQAKFGAEVPVLFIDGRKAFKYRVTSEQLASRLNRKNWPALGFASSRRAR